MKQPRGWILILTLARGLSLAAQTPLLPEDGDADNYV
jgi:hypothetical protein